MASSGATDREFSPERKASPLVFGRCFHHQSGGRRNRFLTLTSARCGRYRTLEFGSSDLVPDGPQHAKEKEVEERQKTELQEGEEAFGHRLRRGWLRVVEPVG